MDVGKIKLSTISIIILSVFTITAGLCSAQEWSRKGKAEIFGSFTMISSETVEYSYPEDVNQLPVTFDMDSTYLYGFGFGYNITDHWNINTDLLFGSADADVMVAGTKVESEDMDYILWDINIDYSIWKSRLTPFVTAGIGLVDFGIDTTTYAGKVHESNFSSNLGAGVRWDITDNLMLKVLYRSIWTEVHDADNDQRYDNIGVNIGYMF